MCVDCGLKRRCDLEVPNLCVLCGNGTYNREKCRACRRKAQPGPYHPLTAKQVRTAIEHDKDLELRDIARRIGLIS